MRPATCTWPTSAPRPSWSTGPTAVPAPHRQRPMVLAPVQRDGRPGGPARLRGRPGRRDTSEKHRVRVFDARSRRTPAPTSASAAAARVNSTCRATWPSAWTAGCMWSTAATSASSSSTSDGRYLQQLRQRGQAVRAVRAAQGEWRPTATAMSTSSTPPSATSRSSIPTANCCSSSATAASATAPAKYMLPSGIAVDEDGRVYVVDQWFRKIDVYRPAGWAGRPASWRAAPGRRALTAGCGASRSRESAAFRDTGGPPGAAARASGPA